MLIHIICFEASGQQENGIRRGAEMCGPVSG
jgi:hypothetical protein